MNLFDEKNQYQPSLPLGLSTLNLSIWMDSKSFVVYTDSSN